ncbi:MAG: ABC transporter substrate-binding protein [Christensenellales bacterium]
MGVMCPLSGTMARTGELYQAAIETAVQHLEADGFLENYTLKFEYFDDQGTTDGAPTAASLALNNEVDVCIGHVLTTMILVSGQFFEDAEIPLIGIVSGPASVQQGWDYFHIGTVTDADAAGVLAEYLVEEKGLERVFLLARNDEGGMAGAEAVMTELERLGKPAVGYELFATDDTDFTAQILKAKGAQAQAIIGYGLQNANTYTAYQQIESLIGDVPNDIYYCGSTSFAQPIMLELWPHEDLEGVVFPTGYIPNPDDPFVNRFTEDYTKNDKLNLPPGDVPARVYDAVYNIAQALNDMGVYDVDADDFTVKLNDALSNVKRTGVQGDWDYGAFDDGRGLAKGNVGMWHADGTMSKAYPK